MHLDLRFIINKFSPPAYKVSSSLLISGGSSRRAVNRSEFIEGLELTSQSKEIQNEIMVLKSQPLVENVVKALGFNVTYYSKADYLPYRFAGFKRLGKFLLERFIKILPMKL